MRNTLNWILIRKSRQYIHWLSVLIVAILLIAGIKQAHAFVNLFIMPQEAILDMNKVFIQSQHKKPISDATAPPVKDDEAVLPPLLKRACSCESWGDPDKEPRQFLPDGSVIRGQTTPDDIGMCQINTKWDVHGKRLSELKLNVYTIEDNIKFALMLYKEQGMRPWEASKSCWQKTPLR